MAHNWIFGQAVISQKGSCRSLAPWNRPSLSAVLSSKCLRVFFKLCNFHGGFFFFTFELVLQQFQFHLCFLLSLAYFIKLHSSAAMCLVKLSQGNAMQKHWSLTAKSLSCRLSFFPFVPVWELVSVAWNKQCGSWLCMCQLVFSHVYVFLQV